MENITIKLNTRYKSLQEGFEWKDIPSFAVLTGVNGVGKSQLLEVIKGKSEKLNNRGSYQRIAREVISKAGPTNLIFSGESTQNRLSLNGLIDYVRNRDQRLVSIRELDDNIKSYQNTISNLQVKWAQTTDKVERLRLDKQKDSFEGQIKRFQEQKLDFIIYPYDEELKRVAQIIGKNVEELNEDDIRRNAVDNFESLTTVDELSRYLKSENQRYMRRVTGLMEKGQNEAAKSLVAQERPYQTINRLFSQYNFNYFDMLNPFPDDGKLNGEICFQGKGGEVIDYNSLSRGEQAIVQFVIWSYGQDFRGNRLNTMVLDEPDAHLHSSMCKMMVEIFSELSAPKETGGGGIRIIITTHSPSTVAFTPEGSLFVMQREDDNTRTIRPTTSEKAVEILSDGIFTFSKAMSNFTILSESTKHNLVFVEGKTDVKHFTRAMQVLGYNLDVDFFDMHNASSLSSFISCAPARLFNKKSLIALYDCDKEGDKGYNKGRDCDISGVKVVTSEQCEGKSFCIKILPPAGLEKYCPVEYLYSKDVLDSNHVLTKRNFTEYINLMGLSTSEDAKTLSEEYDNESTLRPFKVNDDRKNTFSEVIQNFSDPEIFKGFKPTLELIAAILSR